MCFIIDPIKILIRKAPQNDCWNRNFVKDLYAVEAKMISNLSKSPFMCHKFSVFFYEIVNTLKWKNFFDIAFDPVKI